MPYSNAIPQPGDLLSQSQADILANFAAIQTWIAVNHGIFGAADDGKHKWVSLPNQGADVVTVAHEKAIYAKQSALSGVAELFIRNESSGTITEFTSSTQAVSGYTRLPSGILIKWGTGNTGSNAATTANFEATIAFNAIYIAVAARQGQAGDAGPMYVQSFNVNSITVYNASANVRAFYYIAIGI